MSKIGDDIVLPVQFVISKCHSKTSYIKRQGDIRTGFQLVPDFFRTLILVYVPHYHHTSVRQCFIVSIGRWQMEVEGGVCIEECDQRRGSIPTQPWRMEVLCCLTYISPQHHTVGMAEVGQTEKQAEILLQHPALPVVGCTIKGVGGKGAA